MRSPDELWIKDPAADEPQGFDWTAWLAGLGAGTTIVDSSWTITGPDAALTPHDAAIVNAGLMTQVYLKAGTLGRQYTVTNAIVTSNNPAVSEERSFVVLVEDR